MLLKGWADAPAVVALPVKEYFAVFSNVRNGLFEGFFYVAAGAVLGMRHERLGRLPVAALVAATIFGVLGACLSATMLICLSAPSRASVFSFFPSGGMGLS